MDNKNPEIKIGAKVNEVVQCGQCKKETAASQAYRCKGKKGSVVFICEGCKEILDKAFKAETQNPNMPMAVLAGLFAAIIAGSLWYAFTVITNYQVGYVAIGVGFLIGYAVRLGSGKRRGFSLQMVSAGITLATLFISQYFVIHHYARKYMLENQAQFPGYNGQFFLLSPLNPEVIKEMISPIGLIIWAVGIYFAYLLLKPRSI
jgi:hypothetical protein